MKLKRIVRPEWVHRNEDKPHRCPECHHVATWRTGQEHWGPRTTVRCDTCGVRWKMGSRWSKNKAHRLNRRLREWDREHEAVSP